MSTFGIRPVRTMLLGLPLLLALPTSTIAAEEIEVVGDAPKNKRPGRPNMALDFSKMPSVALSSQVWDFPTGIRFIMQSDRSHKYVSVLMVVNHGASDDPVGKEGTAHFAEHTWFRSQHGTLPPIMTLIQDLGVSMNATTRFDTTDFRTVASSEFLPLLMRLESLRLTEPHRGVTEEQIDTEREVVRNEWRRRNEQGQNLFFDSLTGSVFPEDHPYHSRETNDSLDKIDLKTLQTYMDSYYTPENSTVVVVGDFDPNEARSLIFKNFDLSLLDPNLKDEHIYRYPRPGIENPDPENEDHWLFDAVDPNNPDKAYPTLDPNQFKPRVATGKDIVPLPAPADLDEVPRFKAAVDNQIVAVGWSLPGGFRGNDTSMVVLGNLASNYLNSAMRQRGYLDTDTVRRGLKDPGCFAMPQKVHTMVACAIEVTDPKRWNDPQRVADLMVDQLPQIWNPEMVQMMNKYGQRGKMDSIAATLRSVDDVAAIFGARADAIGFHAHHTGSITYHSDAIREMSSLDMNEVSRLGYEYLKRDRAATIVIEPIPSEEIDRTAETSSYHGASEGDAVLEASDDLANITKEDIAASYVQPNLEDLTEFKLKNGMRVVVVPHGESPIVRASIVHGGGSYNAPLSHFDLLNLFSESEYGADPLAFAAQTGSGFGDTYSSSYVEGPASNLDSALWMLREKMETMRVVFDGRPTWARKQVNGFIDSSIHSRGWHISDMTSKHLYPDQPARWTTHWDEVNRWANTAPTEVKALADRVYQPGNTTLVIVGNIDADEAKRLAVDYFAGWEPTSGVDNTPYEAPKQPSLVENGTKVLIFDDEDRTQSQVTYACRLNYEGVGDIQTVSLLSNIVRDRTFSQLRVKEGLAYSPGGFSAPTRDQTASLFFSSLAVNVGVGRTVEFFKQMVDKLEAGEIDDLSLRKYQLRRARNLGLAAQSTSQMSSKLMLPITWNQPWSMLMDAGQHIADVDAPQIKRITQGCNGRAITTIEGPAEIITPQLEERGIEYEIVDYKARGDELHAEYDPKGYKKYDKKRKKAEAKKAAKEAEEASSEEDDGSADSKE